MSEILAPRTCTRQNLILATTTEKEFLKCEPDAVSRYRFRLIDIVVTYIDDITLHVAARVRMEDSGHVGESSVSGIGG